MKRFNSGPRLFAAATTAVCLQGLVLLGPSALANAAGVTLPLDDVHTVALASTGVPVEHDFTATAGTTYYVTLTDVFGQLAGDPSVGSPSEALKTLKLAISYTDANGSDVLVKALVPQLTSGTGSAANQLVVDPTPTGATTGTGTASFTAPVSGIYRIHVVGAPDTNQPAGPITLQVSASYTTGTPGTPIKLADGTTDAAWGDTIGPALATAADVAYLVQKFTVLTTGTYTVTFNDMHLPTALAGWQLDVLHEGGSLTDADAFLLQSPGSPVATAATCTATACTVTLNAGRTYELVAAAQSNASGTAGLFSVSVSGASTVSPTSCWIQPIGTTVLLGSSTLAAGSYTLALNDLAFPAALTNAAAVAISSSQCTATGGTATSAGTTASFSASGTDSYSLYGAATADATATAGSYSVRLAGPPTALSYVQPVTTASSAWSGYAWNANKDTTLDASASYTFNLMDFSVPVALTTVQAALVKGGVRVAGSTLNTTSASTYPVSTSALTGLAGDVSVLVFAKAGTAGGLMGLSLMNAGGALVFDQPQGVGAAFKTSAFSVAAHGNYQLAVTDLQWPAAFSPGGQFTTVITQGSNLTGKFENGGSFATTLDPGTYYLNVIATPAGADSAGTYAVNIKVANPPTVSLKASASTVSSGGTVALSWTSTNATSCTASGGGWSGTFSGSNAASGSATSPGITASATFTLTCSGVGGSVAQSVTVGITSGSTDSGSGSSSKGGGGALDLTVLLALSGLLAARRGHAPRSR